MGTRALLSFQELGSAPVSACLHPLIQELHPREEMGGKKVGPPLENAQRRPVPSPPPAGRRQVLCDRLVGGGPARWRRGDPPGPAAARACPVPRPLQGPGDLEGSVALRGPGAFEEGRGTEQGSVHTPLHLSGRNPDSTHPPRC